MSDNGKQLDPAAPQPQEAPAAVEDNDDDFPVDPGPPVGPEATLQLIQHSVNQIFDAAEGNPVDPGTLMGLCCWINGCEETIERYLAEQAIPYKRHAENPKAFQFYLMRHQAGQPVQFIERP